MMDQAILAVIRSDFASFNAKCFEILNPGTTFQGNWHLDALAVKLEEARLGGRARLIVTMPPRMLKSSTVSVAWVAFLLGHNPAERIIVTSYNEVLADKLSRDTRTIMESDFYRQAFPKTLLSKRTNLQLETEASGMRFATSIGGPTTGFGGGWLIVDDPHNASEIHSAASRETVKTYFDRSLSSRFNDETTGRIIVVMQRLHADDLAGHLLVRGGWDELKFPARATEDREVEIGRSRPHVVKAGDLLDPQRLPGVVLADKLLQMGSANFQAQYQQEPVPETGNMIQRAWLRYYEAAPRAESGKVVLSLDTATKTDPANDYSACTAWLEKDGDHHLLDTWRDRVTFTELKRRVTALYELHGRGKLLIEDQGTGASLIQELQNEGIPAIKCKSRDSKESRLSAASAYIESGKMLLPKDAHWLAAFETELLGFPSVRHDDQVDTVSQYFAWVRERPRGFMNLSWGDGPDDTPDVRDLILGPPQYLRWG